MDDITSTSTTSVTLQLPNGLLNCVSNLELYDQTLEGRLLSLLWLSVVSLTPVKDKEVSTPLPNTAIETCEFCGKTRLEVRKIIAGPTCYICDECIELCADLINDKGDEA